MQVNSICQIQYIRDNESPGNKHLTYGQYQMLQQQILKKYINLINIDRSKLEQENVEYKPLVMHFNQHGLHLYLRKMISYLFVQYLLQFIGLQVMRPTSEKLLENSLFLSDRGIALSLIYLLIVFVLVRFKTE